MRNTGADALSESFGKHKLSESPVLAAESTACLGLMLDLAVLVFLN